MFLKVEDVGQENNFSVSGLLPITRNTGLIQTNARIQMYDQSKRHGFV